MGRPRAFHIFALWGLFVHELDCGAVGEFVSQCVFHFAVTCIHKYYPFMSATLAGILLVGFDIFMFYIFY